MTNSQIQALLGAEVIELTFVRRHPKLGWSDIRGLLGTTNYKLLNGDFGSYVLNFQPPKGVGMGYDYKSRGLCVVWDMFRQEYRVFGAEQVNIRQRFKLTTDEDQQYFIEYFEKYIQNMSNEEKLDFMGYIGDEQILKKATTPVQKQSFWSKVKSKGQSFVDRLKNLLKRKK